MAIEPVAALIRTAMKQWMIAVVDAPEMILHDRELSRKTFNSQLAHNDSFDMEISKRNRQGNWPPVSLGRLEMVTLNC